MPVKWIKAQDGDVSDDANWSSPIDPATNALIARLGTYTIMNDGIFDCRSLTLDAPGITFDQSAPGELSLRVLKATGGTHVDLDGTTHVRSLLLTDADLTIGGGATFSAGSITLSNSTLAVDETIRSRADLSFSGGCIFTENGGKAVLGGSLTVAAGAAITFSGTGSFLFTGTSASAPFFSFTIDIGGGATVRSGASVNGFAFHDMFGRAGSVTVDAGATLDITGQGSIGMSGLSGTGAIIDKQGGASVFLSNSGFHGHLFGADVFTFFGVNSLSSAVIDDKALLTFPGGSEASIDLSNTRPTPFRTGFIHIDMGSNGTSTVIVDATSFFRFDGKIAGFGAGDSIEFKHVAFVNAVLDYHPNSSDPSAGGTLIIRDVTNEAATTRVHIEGQAPDGTNYSLDDFQLTVADDGNISVYWQHPSGLSGGLDALI